MSSDLCLVETSFNCSGETQPRSLCSDAGLQSWWQNGTFSICVSSYRTETLAVSVLTRRRCRALRSPSTCLSSSFSLLPVARSFSAVSLLSSAASSGWSWDHSSWREACSARRSCSSSRKSCKTQQWGHSVWKAHAL